MADRRRDALTASASVTRTVERRALVAAASIVQSTRQLLIRYRSWQDESWAMYDAIGEYNAGVTWLSNSMSRVRLLAAVLTPGGDEPEPIEDGPAADIMQELCGGLPGQAAMMSDFGVHLPLVGDCWLTGEVVDGEQLWVVRSADEVQPIQRKRRSRLGQTFSGLLGNRDDDDAGTFQIQVDDGVWRPIADDSLVCRIWEKDRHFGWKATAVGKAALAILREINLYDRRIIALLISRLAMNGILAIPEEITVPVRPEFQDEADPLVAQLVDIAAKSISEPGTALAALPIPWRIPGDAIEKIKHITFHDQADSQARNSLLDDRDKAITRLARTLRMPVEALLGTGDSNHWNAWLGDEQSIKIFIAPPIETVCQGLTLGYLHPMLRAAHEPITLNGDRIIVWYDTSELTSKPDLSQQVLELRDRLIVSDAATRKESGVDESAEPSPDEFKRMALVKLLDNPQLAAEAYEKLTGDKFTPPAPPPGAPAPNGPGEGEPGDGATTAPGGGNTPPTRPDQAPSEPNGARPITVVVAPPR